jgi:prepilin-type N-terminal cleavage/methylation domain-containing protein
VCDSQRGFTLLETAATLAIATLLLTAGGIWMLGSRPGALTQTTGDVDSALVAARTLAATGDGATLVFAPRTQPGARGFWLRVYRGRPRPGAHVTPTTVMPLVSDASVDERTLGVPPFAIFFGASGHVSGAPHYPQLAEGQPQFATITVEPPCPPAGFVLRFALTPPTVQTRRLPCAATPLSVPGLPNPSPTPNHPIVAPTALRYHWPADAPQSFVAVEWGYTHWFATTDRFACGSGIASFPNVLPSPYSPPYTPLEAQASPSPPPMTPYSYPNSGGGSMNDAPALFPLAPAAAGLCDATVTDDAGQTVGAQVQVMGWLTATYNLRSYVHFSKPTLHLPSSAFGKRGATTTIALSKTYDADPLQPAVTFDRACAPYVGFSSQPGKTPHAPSESPATASLILTLATMPKSRIECGGTIYDQYRGSLAGEGVPFNATLGAPPCPNSGNAWNGPTDGVCYDLYAIPTGMTQTPGWIEESLAGFYEPHATPGTAIYQWVVGDGTCSLQQLSGTDFATWGILLSNGNPTPPPVATPQPVPNPAGFGVANVPNAAPVTSAPEPDPTSPPPWLCKGSPLPSTPP